MKSHLQRPTTKSLLLIGVVILIMATVAGAYVIRNRSAVQDTIETFIAHTHPAPADPFPKIDTSKLTLAQQRIIPLLEQEYHRKPVSFNPTVLKYSQGNKEPWCADFVSWIYNQAGIPLKNQNSGNWRIPGVATLQEYFQSEGHYQLAGDYTPKPGDVAIFRHDRSHASVVLAVHGKIMTTVGGNEDGHVKIYQQNFDRYTMGLSGFGTL